MSISEHFRYWNDVFQSDIFVSDIGITDVDVGYWISPTLRSMSMPTYGYFHYSRFLMDYYAYCWSLLKLEIYYLILIGNF
jgi:hypothetical protein